MKRAFPFVLVAIAFTIGLGVGGFLTQIPYNLSVYSPQRLVEAIRDGTVLVGSELRSLPLMKPRASHTRTNADGNLLETVVYQSPQHIVLLNAQDGKVRELTVWSQNAMSPEIHLNSK